MERLSVPPRLRGRILEVVLEGRKVQKKIEEMTGPSAGEVHRLLSPLSREVVIYAWARTARRSASAAIGTYLRESVYVTTHLRGRDLRELGYPPGPDYRRMLAALLRERVDGRLPSREEEVRWILQTFPPVPTPPRP